MKLGTAPSVIAACLALMGSSTLAASTDRSPLVIPEKVAATKKRLITVDDLARIRDINNLSISPDGERFAILVRQAVPEANTYRMAWFIGSVRGGPLKRVGDGGEARLLTHTDGSKGGEVGGSVSRWSPDGRFIAYMLLRDGEVQLWKSSIDGDQQQLTHNASDVRDFAWSEDGKSLLFKVGTPRADLAAREEARGHSGYRLQEFSSLFRALHERSPHRPLETNLTIWRVGADGSDERPANEAEKAALAKAEKRQADFLAGGTELDAMRLSAARRPPVMRADGASVWAEPADPAQDGPMPFARLRARIEEGAEPIVCPHALCEGQLFSKIWWSADGREVLFWRYDGDTEKKHSLYAWAPGSGAVRTLISSDEHILDSCEPVANEIVCLRETPLQPRHVAAIHIRTGTLRRIADVNPEFASFDLGRVERIEWGTGPTAAKYRYSSRTFGFILYPPGYDARKKYPLFIAPYTAGGFLRGDLGDEHPMLVYAANGFIVLNSTFPGLIRHLTSKDYVKLMRHIYEASEGYPHLTIFADSTFAGLDAAMKRASIDPLRVGSGGVSHGAFIPLLMMQREKRIAALSAAGGSWNQIEYYFSKLPEPFDEPQPTMWPEDPEFWKPIDLAYNLDQVEAPILFHIPDSEMVGTGILLRRMSDARLPFDAFVFPNELHQKWQPAHRLAIYRRNLDWFRFWLQDIEDPNPETAEQYERWRKLRALQCENKKSLRDYCNVTSRMEAPR
jgi:dipeptidyl aminopeptidase/acylaminoacyl peptidase